MADSLLCHCACLNGIPDLPAFLALGSDDYYIMTYTILSLLYDLIRLVAGLA